MDIEMLQALIENLRDDIRELKRELEEIKKQLKPVDPCIPWDRAPEWARWAAMDSDGQWYWYAIEPDPASTIWHGGSHVFTSFDHPRVLNWRNSKQERP
jgi:hypothetical protein